MIQKKKFRMHYASTINGHTEKMIAYFDTVKSAGEEAIRMKRKTDDKTPLFLCVTNSNEVKKEYFGYEVTAKDLEYLKSL